MTLSDFEESSEQPDVSVLFVGTGYTVQSVQNQINKRKNFGERVVIAEFVAREVCLSFFWL